MILKEGIKTLISISFCHSERSEESLLYMYKGVDSSEQAPLTHRMICLLEF